MRSKFINSRRRAVVVLFTFFFLSFAGELSNAQPGPPSYKDQADLSLGGMVYSKCAMLCNMYEGCTQAKYADCVKTEASGQIRNFLFGGFSDNEFSCKNKDGKYIFKKVAEEFPLSACEGMVSRKQSDKIAAQDAAIAQVLANEEEAKKRDQEKQERQAREARETEQRVEASMAAARAAYAKEEAARDAKQAAEAKAEAQRRSEVQVGKRAPQSFLELMQRDGLHDGASITGSPKPAGDGLMYGFAGIIETFDGEGAFIAKEPDGGYFYATVPSALRQKYLEVAKMNRVIYVSGRYVKNREYLTRGGQKRVMPFVEVTQFPWR